MNVMKGPTSTFSAALCVLLIACTTAADYCPSYSSFSNLLDMAPKERLHSVRGVWEQQQRQQHLPINSSCLETLRKQAWEMFDHSFSNYMKHAFPMDNLLPVSCKGADWQGGVGLTLVDSLDMLLLLNRRADIQEALKQLEWTLSFEKDVKVHVFETTIRVLGGLLSGHVLLDGDPGIAPAYDGLLLRKATDLGERLLAAFQTPTGLPGAHVHLQKGIIDTEKVSCTACAGTLLLEFGLLSKLTGRDSFMKAAHHAAQLLFDQRSSLGLVGSSFHVVSRSWSHKDSTIGPGSDSYYEYLLKAYMMFGDRVYLDMFTELYVATMKHMQVPGQHGASSSAFLLDVHMDSGRLLKPWVSSLGAFWPAMQVLAGQHDDAARLHSNFTAAWSTWGWLPELFGADLSAVHPEDPGYNLRPEHIESTWYLKALTGDPTGSYTRLAATMMQVLNHSRTSCGYAPIKDVKTGTHTDLMESYFLSETVKYLYLSFIDSAPLLDYYLLSTEGHLMTAFPHPADEEAAGHLGKQPSDSDAVQGNRSSIMSEDSRASIFNSSSCDKRSQASRSRTASSRPKSSTASNHSTIITTSLIGQPLLHLPANCRPLCAVRTEGEEEAMERRLRAALPLLPIKRISSRRIRYRRCVACVHTSEALAANPPDSPSVRLARLNFGQGQGEIAAGSPAATSASTLPPDVMSQLGANTAGGIALAQVVCVLQVVGPKGMSSCKTLRRLTALDGAVGLSAGSLILQLTAVPQQQTEVVPSAALLVGFEGLEEEAAVGLEFTAAEAAFGTPLPQLSNKCIEYLAQGRARLAVLPDCPLVRPDQPPGYLSSSSAWQQRQRQQQRMQRRLGTQSGFTTVREEFWTTMARSTDPWTGVCPTAHTCWPLLQQKEQQWYETAAAAAADWYKPSRGWSSEACDDGSCEKTHQHQGTALLQNNVSDALMSGCVGLNVNIEFGSSWVSAAEFSRPGGPCVKHNVSTLPRAAPLVMTKPANACGSYLRNAASVRGAIAVVLRGDCSFLDKAMTVDAAGAVGLVVLNLLGQGEMITMSGDETGRTPDIPSVLLGGQDAVKLLWWMERHPLVGALTAYNLTEQQQQQEQQQKEQQQKQQQRQEQSQVHVQPQKQQQPPKQEAGSEGACNTKVSSGVAASSVTGASVIATAGGVGGQPVQQALLQTRVDLFVPGRTQRWLQDNVVKAGGSVDALYAALVREPKILMALQHAMHGRRSKP